jgi:hypothetical protein
LAERDKRLLLLVDEGEALIDVARVDPLWLAWLRKVLHEGKLRTIMTATKRLTQLNEVSAEWTTSPFLFGFSLANLWKLDVAAARNLVIQSQGDMQVQVSEPLMQDILDQTNRHPYLIQFLCKRLFEQAPDGQGRLRPVEAEDLTLDEILEAYFANDFQQLTATERKLVLALTKLFMASEQELLTLVVDVPPRRIQMLLNGLKNLGYVRCVDAQWRLGNVYVQRWLQDNWELLHRVGGTAIDENAYAHMIEIGRKSEIHYLEQRIALLEDELDELIEALENANPVDRTALEGRMAEVKSNLGRMEGEMTSIDRQSGA